MAKGSLAREWETWEMKDFGLFLSNLRNSAELSLEELAKLVDSSKSTLSRLENNEVPQPFKGSIRKLILALAEILCTSKKETERYLDLANIDKSLLTETEEIQLGFTPRIASGSPEETVNLSRWERIYEQLLQELEGKEVEVGISNSPPNLKLKIQEYANILQEIRNRLYMLNNKQSLTELGTMPAAQVHYANSIEGRLVVGHQYGEEFHNITASSSLYAFASPNARWLMQLANIERFSVDDCIVLTNSRDFAGWGPGEIKTTLLTAPQPIPDDLEQLQQEKIPVVAKDYMNTTYYRLVSYTPSFSERKRLEVVLAPLEFYNLYSLNLFFDEPLLATLDGSKISIRQKYGNTALTYSSTERGTSLIPAPVSIQCVLVTKDQQIVLMQRSFAVAYYPNHWSASFEETMNAPEHEQQDGSFREGDVDFFAGAIRGLDEEFAIPANAVESIKVLSLNVEYLTLSVDVITVIRVNLTAEEIKQNWLLRAWHRDEASRFDALPTDLSLVVDKLFSKTLWHPTARMRLIQFLFHTYGIDEVAKAIKEKSDTLEV
ncbi:MAG TPA: helix-turn-helix transcriptional regulator [Ktedonobacteraceae bacterium]|nr:helix-turn-helix transcriptional regulator [Ktedonobacteraceae bacterium]